MDAFLTFQDEPFEPEHRDFDLHFSGHGFAVCGDTFYFCNFQKWESQRPFPGCLTDFFRLLDNHYFQLTSAK